jgi:hypothetical protein
MQCQRLLSRRVQACGVVIGGTQKQTGISIIQDDTRGRRSGSGAVRSQACFTDSASASARLPAVPDTQSLTVTVVVV